MKEIEEGNGRSLAQTTYPCLPTAITWPCLNFSFLTFPFLNKVKLTLKFC